MPRKAIVKSAPAATPTLAPQVRYEIAQATLRRLLIKWKRTLASMQAGAASTESRLLEGKIAEKAIAKLDSKGDQQSIEAAVIVEENWTRGQLLGVQDKINALTDEIAALEFLMDPSGPAFDPAETQQLARLMQVLADIRPALLKKASDTQLLDLLQTVNKVQGYVVTELTVNRRTVE